MSDADMKDLLETNNPEDDHDEEECELCAARAEGFAEGLGIGQARFAAMLLMMLEDQGEEAVIYTLRNCVTEVSEADDLPAPNAPSTNTVN